MTKRKLNEFEQRITEKNLAIHKEDIEYLEQFLLPETQFVIDTRHIVVKNQLRELESKKKVILSKLKELKSIVEISEKQLLEGVDIKKEEKGGKK